MLGKLIKHDLYQTGRLFLWILIIGVVGGGIGALITLNQDIGAGQFFAAFIYNMFLIPLGMITLLIVGLILLMVHNNRSLFTERGYLTFALPVSSTKLLLSKFISSFIFLFLSTAQLLATLIVVMSNMLRLIENLGVAFAEQMGMGGMEGMDEMFEEMAGLPDIGELTIFTMLGMTQLLAYLILAAMVILFALTVSHVRPFSSVPGMWIVFFLVTCLAFSITAIYLVSNNLRMIWPLYFGGALLDGQTIDLNITGGFMALGLTTGFFFLTNWLLRRKISLK